LWLTESDNIPASNPVSGLAQGPVQLWQVTAQLSITGRDAVHQYAFGI
jgi:hypothetical protein